MNVMERMEAIGADKKIADFRKKQQQSYEFKSKIEMQKKSARTAGTVTDGEKENF